MLYYRSTMIGRVLVKSLIAIILVVVIVVVGVSIFNMLPSRLTDGATGSSQRLVSLSNLSAVPTDSGVIVVHRDDFSLNFLGRGVSEPLQNLFNGDPTSLLYTLEEQVRGAGRDSNIYEALVVKPIPTGEDASLVSYAVDATKKDSVVSVLIPATVDGKKVIAFIDGQPLYTKEGEPRTVVIGAQILVAAVPEGGTGGAVIAHHNNFNTSVLRFQLSKEPTQ